MGGLEQMMPCSTETFQGRSLPGKRDNGSISPPSSQGKRELFCMMRIPSPSPRGCARGSAPSQRPCCQEERGAHLPLPRVGWGLGGRWEVRHFRCLYSLAKQVSRTQTKQPCPVPLSSGREMPLCLRLNATGKADKALLLSNVSNHMGKRGPGSIIQGAGGQTASVPAEPLTSSGRPALINPFSSFFFFNTFIGI